MSEAKELLIRMSKVQPNCYEVYYEGGGELPDDLKGQYFTNPDWAQRAIEDYLSKKAERGNKRGTTRSKSGAN